MKPKLPAPRTTSASQQRIGDYVVERAGDNVSISVNVDASGRPAQSFSSTWCGVEAEAGRIRLCFGHRLGKRLRTRIDIAFGLLELKAILTQSSDFIERLFSEQPEEDLGFEGVAVDDPERYYVESASLTLMAYIGSQAEIVCYWVEPWDLHLLTKEEARPKPLSLNGPRPVVTISLAKSHLRYLLDQALTACNAVDRGESP